MHQNILKQLPLGEDNEESDKKMKEFRDHAIKILMENHVSNFEKESLEEVHPVEPQQQEAAGSHKEEL